MYIQEQELLVQYGVKGRSGRRRGSGTRKKSNKKVDKTRLSKRELLAAEAAKRQREIAKIKKMDLKDLSELVERKRLEKALIDLAPSAPKKKKYIDGKQIGANIVSRSVENIASRSVENIGTQLTSAALAKAVNKLVGRKIVFANNKKK